MLEHQLKIQRKIFKNSIGFHTTPTPFWKSLEGLLVPTNSLNMHAVTVKYPKAFLGRINTLVAYK